MFNQPITQIKHQNQMIHKATMENSNIQKTIRKRFLTDFILGQNLFESQTLKIYEQKPFQDRLINAFNRIEI